MEKKKKIETATERDFKWEQIQPKKLTQLQKENAEAIEMDNPDDTAYERSESDDEEDEEVDIRAGRRQSPSQPVVRQPSSPATVPPV